MNASALMMAAALVAVSCDAAQSEAPEAGPAHRDLAASTSADCSNCHAAIAREWRGSRHAGAWTDPLVQAEYDAAPDPRCVACHAPRSEPEHRPQGLAAADGIDCRSCHVEGASLTPLVTLARSEACARCHQIRFLAPGPEQRSQLAYDPSGWLQDTLGEWRRSDASTRGVGCRDCHMRLVGDGPQRHRSHAFPGMLDVELVARGVIVEVEAERRGGTVFVDAKLSPGEIGHAFPTGDLFREAVFRVWTEEPESDSAERRLKRWFALGPRERPDTPAHLSEVEDTRVPPPGAGPPRRYALRLRSPAAHTVAWTLELHASRDASPDLAAKVLVAEGRVAIAIDSPGAGPR